MKRVKKHKVKTEKPEASTSQFRDQEEHDLAYYIHDRVELVHQVFSVLKYKDLKAMAPECVRHISIDDLQELCTEELLGISSKRLCAILDGAEPPSDTESSSQSESPALETISLDSISSDEEILSQASKKKKKHKHRSHDSTHSKSKSKKKKSKDSPSEDVEKSKASRAGLTVLELLELQARARAIRAQLQQEQAAKQPSETVPPDSSHHSSDNEVEIKEEPADVVEISSEDEKPKIEDLHKENLKTSIEQTEKVKSPVKQTSTTKQPSPIKPPMAQPEETMMVTKKINDLIITVPQAKPTRKIKLNRNNVTVSVLNVVENNGDVANIENSRKATIVHREVVKVGDVSLSSVASKVKPKSKKRKKEKKEDSIEEDHDEITLQLSDSEKMDLLQDLDRKAFEKVSSSEDSESSSESDSQNEKERSKNKSLNKNKPICTVVEKILEKHADVKSNSSDAVENKVIESTESYFDSNIQDKIMENEKEAVIIQQIISDENVQHSTKNQDLTQNTQSSCEIIGKEVDTQNKEPDGDNEKSTNENKLIMAQTTYENSKCLSNIEIEDSFNNGSDSLRTLSKDTTEKYIEIAGKNTEHAIEIATDENIPIIDEQNCNNPVKFGYNGNNIVEDTNQSVVEKAKQAEKITTKAMERELSEGEVSDRGSSEVEACELKPDIVCISDEESSGKKKKKKKDKKSKKNKSKKSKTDFQECADQNFYTDENNEGEMKHTQIKLRGNTDTEVDLINIDYDDDVYEILELSDDSSCYEVEGTVLSKEPTTEEILALSAKIDEIEREEVVTDEQIRAHERMLDERENNDENVENISWKDRYLGSKKVKNVLSTSNILNALRKKNKELKNKLEISKKNVERIPTPIEKPVDKLLEEGSIEHYNMLEGSTKFVDPVKEPEKNELKNEKSLDKSAEIAHENVKTVENNGEIGGIDGEPVENTEEKVMKEMKKDAKQLLKMYRKLLKYNDINKKKDPNKKKKKKQKKAKNKDCDNEATVEVSNVM